MDPVFTGPVYHMHCCGRHSKATPLCGAVDGLVVDEIERANCGECYIEYYWNEYRND